MKKRILLLILILCSTSAAYGQGTPVIPYMSEWVRTLFDDETQLEAQTTLNLDPNASVDFNDLDANDLTVTNCAVLGSDSAVFQPNADSTTFFQVNDAAGAGVITANTINRNFIVEQTSAASPMRMYSADGSDYLDYYHDNSNNYFKTSDGSFIWSTYETNGSGVYRLQGNGSGYGIIGVYGPGNANIISMEARSESGGLGKIYTTSCAYLCFESAAEADILCFNSATEGETRYFAIYGRRTGDSRRIFRMQISADDDDTATFDNVSNYEFRDGTLALRNTTHEDDNGSREIKLDWRGEQSGGERSTLARIEGGHDGTGDDEYGYLDFLTNDGADGDSPTKGARITRAGISTPDDPNTLGAGATTFVCESNVMTITGDGGGNTIGTITGAKDGTLLTMIFVDANVTITDTDAHTANTVDLAGTATNFTSADDKTLQIVYNGTSWYETSRSTN